MLRTRIAFVALGVLLYGAVLVYPGLLAYTEWFGEPTVATVTECHPNGKTQRCQGSWASSDGHRHSGTIDEATTDDIGKQTRIRLGPLGARAEHASSRAAYVALVLALGLGAPIGAAALFVGVLCRQRVAGAQVLAHAVPVGAIRLFGNDKRVWRADGSEVAVLRPASAPQPWTFTSPPGQIPRHRAVSLIDAVRSLAYNPSTGARFVAAHSPDGTTLFVIYRVPAGSFTPETAVLDPAGATRAVIRQQRTLPGAFALLAPDGHHLASITQSDTAGADYSVRDDHGREVGTVAAHRRAWIVQVEDASALLHLALAFTADSYRLRL